MSLLALMCMIKIQSFACFPVNCSHPHLIMFLYPIMIVFCFFLFITNRFYRIGYVVVLVFYSVVVFFFLDVLGIAIYILIHLQFLEFSEILTILYLSFLCFLVIYSSCQLDCSFWLLKLVVLYFELYNLQLQSRHTIFND